MAALEYLETLKNTHPELAESTNNLADLYQKKLWHQLTLALDNLFALAVFQDERDIAPPNPEGTESDVAQSVVAHGLEIAVEFKPVEHPTEPLDNDKPVQCPLPEPSILNDGRIWKERVSAANVMRRTDLPLMKEGSATDSEVASETRSRPPLPNRMMLPSISAPEHNLVNLLEECKSSGII